MSFSVSIAHCIRRNSYRSQMFKMIMETRLKILYIQFRLTDHQRRKGPQSTLTLPSASAGKSAAQ